MSCAKCHDDGFIIHSPTAYSPDRVYTEDCPEKCGAQKKMRARIDAVTTLKTNLSKDVHDRMHELVDEIEKLTEQKRLLFEENGRLLAEKERREELKSRSQIKRVLTQNPEAVIREIEGLRAENKALKIIVYANQNASMDLLANLGVAESLLRGLPYLDIDPAYEKIRDYFAKKDGG